MNSRTCPVCGRKRALFTWSGSGVVECRYCGHEIDRADWETRHGAMRPRDYSEMAAILREDENKKPYKEFVARYRNAR